MKTKTKIKNPAQIRGRGVRVQRFKSFNTSIIRHLKTIRQALPTKRERFTKLIGTVRDGQLTESLEILEQLGFTGDLALFVLGEIAACGGCDE